MLTCVIHQFGQHLSVIISLLFTIHTQNCLRAVCVLNMFIIYSKQFNSVTQSTITDNNPDQCVCVPLPPVEYGGI